jgi:predicted PurR-regulated permease PerM
MSSDKKGFSTESDIKRFNPGHIFLFLLLFAVLFAVFKIIQPYVNTIILAVILASVLSPINAKIEKMVRNRKNLAALISCLFLSLLIVLPLTFVVLTLLNQGISTFNAIQEWLVAGNLDKLLNSGTFQKIIEFVKHYLPADYNPSEFKINQSLMQVSSTVGRFLFDQGGYIVGNISALIGKFFLMIFVFFFLVRDGDLILQRLLHLIPLSATQEEKIITKIKMVAKSVFQGVFLTCLCQGIAGGIALWIAGLPGLFLGTLMVFFSVIPFVGAPIIWIPAAGYLFISGRWGYGIFIIAWHLAVVGTMDNTLRPLFMKGSSGMSPLYILFAILGGLQLYGIIGILYGPLIFGLAMVLLYIYELEFGEFLRHQDKV